MGLIYNPSESQGLVSALNANIRTATEMIDNLNSASKHLIDALNEKTLSGAAYTAGKGMFSQLILPTISKASQSLEHLKSEAQQYEGFASSAGSELLDEDKLNEQLQALQSQQAALTSQISFYNQQATLHPENSDLNTSYADFSKQLSSYMGTTAGDIQKVQDKLKKLHEFDTNVSSLFISSKADFEAILQGISLIGDVTFTKDGKFSIDHIKDGYNLLKGGLQYRDGKLFLGGEKIVETVNSNGEKVLKFGNKFLSKLENGHIYKNGKAFENLTKIKLGDYKQFSKTFKSEFKTGINITEDFKAWKGATKFSKLGKGLGALGTGLTVFDNASEDFKDGVNGESVKNFVVDTTVDVGSSAAATAAGAAFGSLILPPLGTVVGAGLGIAFNYGLNEFKFGNPPKSAVEHIKNGAKAVTKKISDEAEKFANNIGNELSHIFW